MIVFVVFYKTRMRKNFKKGYENTVKLSKLSLNAYVLHFIFYVLQFVKRRDFLWLKWVDL